MFKRVIVVLLVLFTAGWAGAANVPKYLNYQAVLFDDGGNPLPDGLTTVNIRLLDSALNVVYEEQQDVEVVSGIVSIIVGDGTEPGSGAPTGGISAETLLPDGPRYLEVQAEGYPPESLMELVSVPYSTYADVALRVADSSVGASQIENKSITIEHLSDQLISDLVGQMAAGSGPTTIVVKEDFDQYITSMSSTEGAKQVGVNPDFNYSSASDVQDVLKDLDLAIKKRSEDVKLAGARFDTHITDTSNPHGVTTEQIGAVDEADLFKGDGKIKEELLPDGVLPDINDENVKRGRIIVSGGHWEYDTGYSNMTCDFEDQVSHENWPVSCEIQKTKVDCTPVFSTCELNGEIIPRFYLHTSVDTSGAEVPKTYNRFVRREKSMPPDPLECFCIERIEFGVGRIDGYTEGSYIAWQFFKRSLNDQ